MITLTINGLPVSVEEGTTVLEAAQFLGFPIPTLCHMEGLSPYGACRNALNPDYVSGGSSSGSAVAVALGLASFSLGTDTAGSGRVPAMLNNLIGLKPSCGRLSATGVVMEPRASTKASPTPGDRSSTVFTVPRNWFKLSPAGSWTAMRSRSI